MKRLFGYILLLAVFVGFLPGNILAAGERISTYDVLVAIASDGTFRVHERINYDFDTLERHGIFRTIPYVKTTLEGKRFALDFEDISVRDESGKAYTFKQSKEGDVVELKIGDPNRTITGAHVYEIGYVVRGGLTYFSDHDELYWDAIGTEWQVPVDAARLTISLPQDIEKGKLRASCFTGASGSTQNACRATIADSRTVVVELGRPLDAYEGLTVVVGFPKEIVAQLEPRQIDAYKDAWWWKVLTIVSVAVGILFAIVWYGVMPFYIIWRWYTLGRDPKPAIGEARAWYQAPTGRGGRVLTPGETGTLLDESAGMHEVIATLIDLARRGYLRIEERSAKDFYLHRKSEIVAELRPHERTIIDGLFATKNVVRLKNVVFVQTVETVKKQLYESVVSEGFFAHNPQTIRMKYFGLAGVALVTMNFPLAAVAFFFGRAMPRKTPLGAQAAAMGRSLRTFITSQKKQFAFQAKHNMLFEKLLPFAIAFGAEEIWAHRFARLSVPPPDWYTGSAVHSFNTQRFTRNFNNSFVPSFKSVATPTSSSSGFSSGFSGGSSGGGGGGGGGGSW